MDPSISPAGRETVATSAAGGGCCCSDCCCCCWMMSLQERDVLQRANARGDDDVLADGGGGGSTGDAFGRLLFLRLLSVRPDVAVTTSMILLMRTRPVNWTLCEPDRNSTPTWSKLLRDWMSCSSLLDVALASNDDCTHPTRQQNIKDKRIQLTDAGQVLPSFSLHCICSTIIKKKVQQVRLFVAVGAKWPARPAICK